MIAGAVMPLSLSDRLAKKSEQNFSCCFDLYLFNFSGKAKTQTSMQRYTHYVQQFTRFLTRFVKVFWAKISTTENTFCIVALGILVQRFAFSVRIKKISALFSLLHYFMIACLEKSLSFFFSFRYIYDTYGISFLGNLYYFSLLLN